MISVKMPPKRKAAAAKGAGGKKAKKDAAASTSKPEDAEKKAMAALKTQGKKNKVFPVDSHCPLSSGGKVRFQLLIFTPRSRACAS